MITCARGDADVGSPRQSREDVVAPAGRAALPGAVHDAASCCSDAPARRLSAAAAAPGALPAGAPPSGRTAVRRLVLQLLSFLLPPLRRTALRAGGGFLAN